MHYNLWSIKWNIKSRIQDLYSLFNRQSSNYAVIYFETDVDYRPQEYTSRKGKMYIF